MTRPLAALVLVGSLVVLFGPPVWAAYRALGPEDWRASPRWNGRAYLASRDVPIPAGDDTTGVAAALATLARWGGADVDATAVRAELGARPADASLKEVRSAARELGLDGVWADGEPAALPRLKTPFLAQLQGPSGARFVVVRNAREGYVYALDPGRGHLLFPLDRFAETWTGRMLAFPDPPPAPRPWR